MKTIYQSFSEIADDFTNGEFLVHQLSDHSTTICSIWQTAINEFASALDLAGIKLEENPEIYERFWSHATEGLKKWEAGLSRPYAKKLGEITVEEARERYNFSGKIGNKLIVPSFSSKNELTEDYYILK